ncbi:ATP-binding protein [Pseudonocardia sp. T1-2H]|uniref:ATP-binding protein n=1 Tax=Pseudonocardia sp. T1-2H TaxID=3128899 RepID=UPI0040548B45
MEHGAGHGTFRIWYTPIGLTWEIHDPGELRPGLLGLAPPPAAAARGRGLYCARELSHDLHICHDETGTTVRASTR